MHLDEKFYDNCVFDTLTQQEVLERLSSKGIQVTQQTLRNWETNKLITEPARGSGYGGRWTKYLEYVLAECYAVHMLLHVLPKQQPDKLIPKFPIEILAKARSSCRFHPKGLPSVPTLSALYTDPNMGMKVTITEGPLEPSQTQQMLAWTDQPEIRLDKDYSLFVKHEAANTLETLLSFSLLLSAELLWFKYLSEGANLFWPRNPQ